MHGLGNDFVIINAIKHPINPNQLPITKLSNRYTGIGFNQLLILKASVDADFFCQIFNADGSESEQCGNGLRCVGRYLQEEKLLQRRQLSLETKAGVFSLTIEDYDHIRIDLGFPLILNENATLTLMDNRIVRASLLSLGNPHAIIKIDRNKDDQTLPELAAMIAKDTQFPHGVNVGFMHVIDPHHITLRTFERGVGESFACGSNACAAVIAGVIKGWLKTPVNVQVRYGNLNVAWQDFTQSVQLIGPATRVFTGTINLPIS